MNPGARDVMFRRKNRMIASILSVKDDCNMPQEDADWLRTVILDEVNDFYDLVCDMFTSLEPMQSDGVVVNDLIFEKIEQIHNLLAG